MTKSKFMRKIGIWNEDGTYDKFAHITVEGDEEIVDLVKKKLIELEEKMENKILMEEKND